MVSLTLTLDRGTIHARDHDLARVVGMAAALTSTRAR
jgi:hypothetical protein